VEREVGTGAQINPQEGVFAPLVEVVVVGRMNLGSSDALSDEQADEQAGQDESEAD